MRVRARVNGDVAQMVNVIFCNHDPLTNGMCGFEPKSAGQDFGNRISFDFELQPQRVASPKSRQDMNYPKQAKKYFVNTKRTILSF